MTISRSRAGVAGLLLMTALAACGGGSGSSGVATLKSPGTGAVGESAAPSASLDPETAQLEFARCMRENGVDMPDPVAGGGFGGAAGGAAVQVGGDGIDAEKMQKAFETCGTLLGAGGPGDGIAIDPEMQDKLVEFAGCMRDNGVDFPDPGADGGGMISIGGPGGIDPSSSEFQAAQEACQSILGDFGPTLNGPGGGPSGGVQSGDGTITVPAP